MNAKRIWWMVVPLLAAISSGQDSAQKKKFTVYRTGQSNCCIDSDTVTTTETSEGKSLYQVFWLRTAPRHELFRVRIGDHVGRDDVKWWKYGLAAEADFNGDGLPDYVWYGGDDTGFALYLFLSSAGHYKRTDILKTVEAAWQQRFHKAAPDLGGTAGRHVLGETALESSANEVVMSATVERTSGSSATKEAYRFRIAEAHFEP